jgi:hypothetical protein
MHWTAKSQTNHEAAFVSVFVIPEKRARYAEFLPKPERRIEVTRRFNHFFDFVPELSNQIPRRTASEMASVLQALGAGQTAHVIGGRDEIDGKDLPLEEAIDAALADVGGVVVSCVPGQLALYIQEFPPGDTFILSYKP